MDLFQRVLPGTSVEHHSGFCHLCLVFFASRLLASFPKSHTVATFESESTITLLKVVCLFIET